MKQIVVGVNDVEVLSLTLDLVEHHQMMSRPAPNVGVRPPGPRPARYRPRCSGGGAAREEGHIVTLCYERICKDGYDTPGPAIKDGGDRLCKGRDKSDLHAASIGACGY